LELISNILNQTIDDNPYYNSCRLQIFTTLEIIYTYTNISFTDKQKEDVFKMFDLFAGGLGEKILDAIPQEQLDFICENAKDILEAIYKYRNSAMGVMESISNDYSNLDLDVTELQQKIGDPENMALLKDVLNKLG
jgi:hypothetical protein